MNKLDKLINLKLDINHDIAKKERNASKSISELQGVLKFYNLKECFEKIILLKEILNNNKIENIHTTYVNLISAMSNKNLPMDKNTLKTFYNIEAIQKAEEYVKTYGFIDKKIIIEIQKIIRGVNEDIRNDPNVVIKNSNNEIVYIPIETKEEIIEYLNELELFMNNDEITSWWTRLSPLIKMIIIHFQFESIHPFSDGNGRTGRILNMIYLILKDEMSIPLFSLSYFIAKNKTKYYKLINDANKNINNLVHFIEFFLEGTFTTCVDSINYIESINKTYLSILEKWNIKNKEKIVQILFNKLFFNINDFMDILNISRNTASKYINYLIQENILIEIEFEGIKTKNYIFKDLLNFMNEI